MSDLGKWEGDESSYGYVDVIRMKYYGAYSDDFTYLPTIDDDEICRTSEEDLLKRVWKFIQQSGLETIHKKINDTITDTYTLKPECFRVRCDTGGFYEYSEISVELLDLKTEDGESTYDEQVVPHVMELLLAEFQKEIGTDDETMFGLHDDVMSYGMSTYDMTKDDFKDLYERDKILLVDYEFRFEDQCSPEQRVEGLRQFLDEDALKLYDFVARKEKQNC